MSGPSRAQREFTPTPGGPRCSVAGCSRHPAGFYTSGRYFCYGHVEQWDELRLRTLPERRARRDPSQASLSDAVEAYDEASP